MTKSRPTQTQRRLSDIARWAIVSWVVCAGCDSSGSKLDATVGRPYGSDAAAEDEWLPSDCSAGDLPRVLAHVRFTQPLDYAAIYSSFPGGAFPGPGSLPAGTQLLDSVGEPCSGARSATPCLATLSSAQVPSDVCAGQRVCSPFLLTTRGDKVNRIETAKQLFELLGSIDSEHEAELVALFRGRTLACPSNTGSMHLAGTEVRPDEDGYEVHTEWQFCNAPAFSQTLHVDVEGAVIELDNRVVGPTTCFTTQ